MSGNIHHSVELFDTARQRWLPEFIRAQPDNVNGGYIEPYQATWAQRSAFAQSQNFGEFHLFHIYEGSTYFLQHLLTDDRGKDSKLEPIHPNRGLPQDTHPATMKLVSNWEGDTHHETYYLLSELLAYNKWEELNEIKSATDSWSQRWPMKKAFRMSTFESSCGLKINP